MVKLRLGWRRHSCMRIIVALIFIQSTAFLQVWAQECSDVPPYDTPFRCESYREIGQCGKAYVVLGGFCQQSCGRCQIQIPQITYNQTIQQQQLPVALLEEIIRVNTKGIHRREGFIPTQDCVDRNFFQQFSCDGLKQWGQCREKWLQDSGMCNLTCGVCYGQQAQVRQQLISYMLEQNNAGEQDAVPVDEVFSSRNQDIDEILKPENSTSDLFYILQDLVPNWDQVYDSTQPLSILSPLPSTSQQQSSIPSISTPISPPTPTLTPRPAIWTAGNNSVVSYKGNTSVEHRDYSQLEPRVMSRIQTEPLNVAYVGNAVYVELGDQNQQQQSEIGVNVGYDDDSKGQQKPLCLFGNCISSQLISVLGGEVENASSITQQAATQYEIPEVPQLKVQEENYGNLQQLDADIMQAAGPSESDLAYLQSFVNLIEADIDHSSRNHQLFNSTQQRGGADEDMPVLEVVALPPLSELYVNRQAQCSPLLNILKEATFYSYLLQESSAEMLSMLLGNSSSSKAVTLLVPVDSAFNSFSEKERQQMLNDRRLAESILQMSIIPEFLWKGDLVQGQRYDTSFKTGKLVETVKVVQVFPVVTIAGLINNVQIIREDVVACNAVVHFINQVLRPSTLPL